MPTPPAESIGALRARLARYSALNVIGLAVPLGVAYVALPILAHALGPARLGLLTLSWAFLEYLTLFDIGLGKATVRYVADDLARDGRDVSQITAVSLATQLGFGIIGAIVLWIAAPWVATHVLNVQPAIREEATAALVAVALNLPIVLLLTTARGVLDGAQQFGASNALRIPSSTGAVLIPAIMAPRGASIPSILIAVAVWRVVMTIATLITARVRVGGFRIETPRDWVRLRRLISFGGWVAISGIISPMLVYFDRFALGAIVGLAAVGYYTAPYEGITRALLLPSAVTTAMFPVLTAAAARGDMMTARRLVGSATRTLVALMLIPVAIAFAFAPMLLALWVGPRYAAEGALALRILSIGVLVNTIAYVPYSLLESVSRPDIPATLHVAELVVHVPLTLFLIHQFGIPGAAAAWTIRVTIDCAALLVMAGRVTGLRVGDLRAQAQ